MVDQAAITHPPDCRCRPCRIARARAAAGLDPPAFRRAAPRLVDQAVVRPASADDGPRELHLVVVGDPVPQGSMRSFIRKRKRDGKLIAITTSDNPRTKGWRQTIADVVGRALATPQNGGFFLTGPVALEITFYLPRTKQLLTAKHAARAVPHVVAPDLDKLLRAAADSLKYVVWGDDSQITDLHGRKRYVAAGENPRAEIIVRGAPDLALERPAPLLAALEA